MTSRSSPSDSDSNRHGCVSPENTVSPSGTDNDCDDTHHTRGHMFNGRTVSSGYRGRLHPMRASMNSSITGHQEHTREGGATHEADEYNDTYQWSDDDQDNSHTYTGSMNPGDGEQLYVDSPGDDLPSVDGHHSEADEYVDDIARSPLQQPEDEAVDDDEVVDDAQGTDDHNPIKVNEFFRDASCLHIAPPPVPISDSPGEPPRLDPEIVYMNTTHFDIPLISPSDDPHSDVNWCYLCTMHPADNGGAVSTHFQTLINIHTELASSTHPRVWARLMQTYYNNQLRPFGRNGVLPPWTVHCIVQHFFSHSPSLFSDVLMRQHVLRNAISALSDRMIMHEVGKSHERLVNERTAKLFFQVSTALDKCSTTLRNLEGGVHHQAPSMGLASKKRKR